MLRIILAAAVVVLATEAVEAHRVDPPMTDSQAAGHPLPDEHLRLAENVVHDGRAATLAAPFLKGLPDWYFDGATYRSSGR